MSEPPQFTFLFTQDLRGDLRFLPKLARVLWRLRAENKRTITVDLGGSCSPDVWHCAVTEGRSMLVALDGLTYTAANTSGLPEKTHAQLMKSITHMQAVDAAHPGELGMWRFTVQPPDDDDQPTLVIAPHAEARITGQTVQFPSVERYKIGRMLVRWGDLPEITAVDAFDVPPDTPPDATISGMADFIESEARLVQERRKP